MKNLDLLIPTKQAAKDWWSWATVTAINPLAVRLDGDTVPLDLVPDTLVPELRVGDRVWTQVNGRRVIIQGRGNAVSLRPVRQVFTANGTWTKPVGATYVRVQVQGGGGGGGAAGATSSTQASAGGGGGGGGYADSIIPASELGATETVTVGGGGGGSAAGSGNAGSSGGTSSFGSHLWASGGLGGQYGSGAVNTVSNGGAGGNGNVTTGQGLIRQGQYGDTAHILVNEPVHPARGGDSVLGFGARTPLGTAAVAGASGHLYGGGGSGAKLRASQTSREGGDGAAGVVIVETFFD